MIEHERRGFCLDAARRNLECNFIKYNGSSSHYYSVSGNNSDEDSEYRLVARTGSKGNQQDEYWFGFTKKDKVFVDDCENSWIAFACEDKVILMPYQKRFAGRLNDMSKSQKHWNVKIKFESPKRPKMILKEGFPNIHLSPYLVD